MVHGQAFCTSIKHFTHYAPRSGFLYPYQTRYSLCSTVRLSVPLTNMLPTMVDGQVSVPLTNMFPTMVHGQAFRTPNKHVTHFVPRSGFLYHLTNTLPTMVHGQDFRTPNKHVTHYGPPSGFLYP